MIVSGSSDGAARLELTPFVGYRAGQNFDIDASDEEAEVGDHASLALAFGYRGDEFTYEIFYSLQPTEISSPALSGTSDLDVEYLHFGVSRRSSALPPSQEVAAPCAPRDRHSFSSKHWSACRSGFDAAEAGASLTLPLTSWPAPSYHRVAAQKEP